MESEAAPTISATYDSIFNSLRLLCDKTHEELSAILEGFRESYNIDSITRRVKSKKSFLDKAERADGERRAYPDPFRDIQDLIGIRVVVYYKHNLVDVRDKVLEHLHPIELVEKKPASPSEFDYEGVHLILPLSVAVRGQNESAVSAMSGLFELQIKTLFQHSWSQTEHNLGYKTAGAKLDPMIKRKLAFVAAQSWGADHILEELASAAVAAS
ncbi:MAG: RelA/SpoT domain-containing protein [Bacteroidota bacterium]|nr:RelA/SpoT domain-containing protein [Bacteroidota bacterium]MDP4234593.1 RelA/SpoT domain-containing protein [Bacteroidota bacterium]MDP4243722.1 RelA/SpoT domain-containing protein [Bacteroidota bacterium]MDP4288330.1 RelA/SpoT domain-containing protein [Bacteroidota bacterium]